MIEMQVMGIRRNTRTASTLVTTSKDQRSSKRPRSATLLNIPRYPRTRRLSRKAKLSGTRQKGKNLTNGKTLFHPKRRIKTILRILTTKSWEWKGSVQPICWNSPNSRPRLEHVTSCLHIERFFLRKTRKVANLPVANKIKTPV
ncbi:hypothetical protein EGW08_014447, partial [Elysia chlorotica]